MRQTLTIRDRATRLTRRLGSLRFSLDFYDSCKIDVTALDQALQALEALTSDRRASL
jgi:hypothetical protein